MKIHSLNHKKFIERLAFPTAIAGQNINTAIFQWHKPSIVSPPDI